MLLLTSRSHALTTTHSTAPSSRRRGDMPLPTVLHASPRYRHIARSSGRRTSSRSCRHTRTSSRPSITKLWVPTSTASPLPSDPTTTPLGRMLSRPTTRSCYHPTSLCNRMPSRATGSPRRSLPTPPYLLPNGLGRRPMFSSTVPSGLS